MTLHRTIRRRENRKRAKSRLRSHGGGMRQNSTAALSQIYKNVYEDFIAAAPSRSSPLFNLFRRD